MSTLGNVIIEIDPKQLGSLEKALDGKGLQAALDIAATDVHHVAEGAAKDATPVVTGHARRSTVSDVRTASKIVKGVYPYLDWLDVGTDGRGRTMQTRPGGYRIRAAAKDAAMRDAPAALDRAAREVLDRWSGE